MWYSVKNKCIFNIAYAYLTEIDRETRSDNLYYHNTSSMTNSIPLGMGMYEGEKLLRVLICAQALV